MADQTRGVLWDLDGTLIDSAGYHLQSWRDVLAAEGFKLTRERFAESFGRRNDAVLRGYFGPDFPTSEVERIGGAKEARYRELVRAHGVELLPGVKRWLTRLHAGGWRQAVASSAPRLNIEVILEVLGITGAFDAIVAAEDVQRGKPDPQVFLIAAAKLGVPLARCIVVEDAPAGVEAAHRAGMRAIGVRSSHATLPADRVVHTLDELPDDTFERLLHDHIVSGEGD
ncbi:MAG: HAD family phosphatase [Ardenticatenaceae bacterium]|nr:HAD family phosphatase [Ardenticatenaceae bacterium]